MYMSFTANKFDLIITLPEGRVRSIAIGVFVYVCLSVYSVCSHTSTRSSAVAKEPRHAL